MLFLRKIGAVGAATMLLGASAHAQTQTIGGLLPTAQNEPNRQGTRGGNFLHIGIGARSGSMGGSILTSVTGPSAWFTNPAGAATSEGLALTAGFQRLYDDLGINQAYFGANLPLLGGVVGATLNSLNSGQMLRTDELNPFGQRLGGSTFAWTSSVAGVGYARRLTDKFNIGFQVKYISEGITDASTAWVAGDIGTQFNTGLYGITIGGAIQNVGGSAHAGGALLSRVVTTNDGSSIRETRRIDVFTLKTELPVTFQFGVGAEILGTANSMMGGAGGKHTLTAEFSASDATDESTQYGFGAEYGFRNLLFVRAGKRIYGDDRNTGVSNGASNGLGAGFGIRLPVAGRSVKFDYSYQGAGALKNIQIFSFEVGR
ncbi:MAG: PorV/PorQ family protein [Gemmatimonadaceae bacterium]